MKRGQTFWHPFHEHDPDAFSNIAVELLPRQPHATRAGLPERAKHAPEPIESECLDDWRRDGKHLVGFGGIWRIENRLQQAIHVRSVALVYGGQVGSKTRQIGGSVEPVDSVSAEQRAPDDDDRIDEFVCGFFHWEGSFGQCWCGNRIIRRENAFPPYRGEGMSDWPACMNSVQSLAISVAAATPARLLAGYRSLLYPGAATAVPCRAADSAQPPQSSGHPKTQEGQR